MVNLRRYMPAVYLCVLAGVNLYLVHQLFFAEFTGHMNSLQGLWISMARLAGEHWFRPSWWPYQDGGVPFEHTYMPLVPAASALVAKLAHLSASRGFYIVMALMLCLGPLSLFLMIWRMSGAAGSAFWASLIYSLTSPARALLPEGDLNPIRYWSSLRFYGAVVWDDLPHQTAVAFLPLALLFLWRALEGRRPLHYVLAIACMALTVMASVFGATALLLASVCLIVAMGPLRRRENVMLASRLALTAYLLVCPFLPPSLIFTIRSNQQQFVEDRWSAASLIALSIVSAASVAVYLGTRRAPVYLRFFMLFGVITTGIPLLDAYVHSHFIPQPARYTAEMEVGLAMLSAPLLAWAWRVLPRRIAIAAAAFLLSVALEPTGGFLKFTQEATRVADVRPGIEYRIAHWMDANFAGQRIMVPGSIAQWLNVFSEAQQLSGASFSTTPNWRQQDALKSILTCGSPEEVRVAMLWLKAFGVQAATVCGRKSPEFWKGNSSTKFDGLMPVLWRQEDTTVYRVPQRSLSLAHVIRAASVAQGAKAAPLEIRELEKYVAALEDPELPLADMRWKTLRSAEIHAQVARGQVISVQECYHPGWSARANGRAASVRRDGMGFLLIDPRCDGPCTVELTYSGGWEYWLCRLVSCCALAVLASYAWRQRRTFGLWRAAPAV